MSLCLPVHYLQHLAGVTCVDISMDDLLSDVTYFQRGELSYAFMVDQSGRTLMHPLIRRPYDVMNDLAFINIELLEHTREAKGVCQSMMRCV